MKCITIVFVLGLTASLHAQDDASNTIDSWVQMWNTYNLDQVKKLFVDNESVTYFSSERPGLIVGMDELVRHHQSFGFVPGGKQSGSRLWLDDRKTLDQGSTQIITATWVFQREGESGKQRGPVTFVLVESGDTWRILHAHFSNDPGQG